MATSHTLLYAKHAHNRKASPVVSNNTHADLNIVPPKPTNLAITTRKRVEAWVAMHFYNELEDFICPILKNNKLAVLLQPSEQRKLKPGSKASTLRAHQERVAHFPLVF